jgi:hypothetical protein
MGDRREEAVIQNIAVFQPDSNRSPTGNGPARFFSYQIIHQNHFRCRNSHPQRHAIVYSTTTKPTRPTDSRLTIRTRVTTGPEISKRGTAPRSSISRPWKAISIPAARPAVYPPRQADPRRDSHDNHHNREQQPDAQKLGDAARPRPARLRRCRIFRVCGRGMRGCILYEVLLAAVGTGAVAGGVPVGGCVHWGRFGGGGVDGGEVAGGFLGLVEVFRYGVRVA